MKKKILLVEDNPATIDVVQKELEFLGYDAITADDGKKAIEMAASQMPDLIIMDISLPQMDGFEAASVIRKNPKTKTIPILAATARALPGEKSVACIGSVVVCASISPSATHSARGTARQSIPLLKAKGG